MVWLTDKTFDRYQRIFWVVQNSRLSILKEFSGDPRTLFINCCLYEIARFLQTDVRHVLQTV